MAKPACRTLLLMASALLGAGAAAPAAAQAASRDRAAVSVVRESRATIARRGTLRLRFAGTSARGVRVSVRGRRLGSRGRFTVLVRATRIRRRLGRRAVALRVTAPGRRLLAVGCRGLDVRVLARVPARRRILRGRKTYPNRRACRPPAAGAPLDLRPPAQAASFRVGAAARSISSPVPAYAGGFGLSPPIQQEADPLEARALYVASPDHAVAFVTLDVQGYFAATQIPGDFGMDSIRALAARRMSALGGPAVRMSDIIVQSTHSHAAPTTEGIWGPVPTPFLQKLRDQAVDALVAAAQGARTAALQWSSVDAPYLDNIATAQTDSYPGFAQDGQLTVLRAVAPDGATVATFANVPAHADIVNGAKLKRFSADYFGLARAALDRRLGGVSIVGPATLGREESPVQTTGLGNAAWYADAVGELVTRALTAGRWITDGSVGSTERMAEIPGTNPALLGLVAAWQLPDEAKQQQAEQSGTYPIDRSLTPPYQVGNTIGTPLTAVRIGRLAYLSMPGEPFPEVRFAIANAVQGADQIVALSKSQDDLGYFYPAFDYGFTFAYPSDHGTYNVAPQSGDQIIQEQIAGAGRLGFGTAPTAPLPADARYEQALQPGLQALAAPARGDAGPDGRFTTTLQAIYSPADFRGNPLAGKVHWDFGDGTSADTDAVEFGEGGRDEARFEHAFPAGSFTVRLSARDTQGNVARWEVPVVVHPPLRAVVREVRRRGRTVTYAVSAAGGDGRVLAARWTFAGGGTADGAEVTHAFPASVAPRATVTVTDGTGTSAAARSPGG